MKKVSIIIPVYNVDKYIYECLNSVINQTYKNLEIIIINDGSTDNSKDICQQFMAKDNRIKLINQKNSGAAIAKNVGLDNITGDYVTFIDSDDYVNNDWINIMVNALEKNDADVVESNFYIEYVNENKVGNKPELYKPGKQDMFSYLKVYLDNWTCSLFWNKLFKAELTKSVRFKNERRCIDDEFYTYKVLVNAKSIVRINDLPYHYRQRKTSAVFSEKNNLQKTNDALDILLERLNIIKNKYSKLSKIYVKHDVEMLFYFANNMYFDRDTYKKLKHITWKYLIIQFSNFQGIKLIKQCLFLIIKAKKITNRPKNEVNREVNNRCFE